MMMYMYLIISDAVCLVTLFYLFGLFVCLLAGGKRCGRVEQIRICEIMRMRMIMVVIKACNMT